MLNVKFTEPADEEILTSEINPDYLNGLILVYSGTMLRGQILYEPRLENRKGVGKHYYCGRDPRCEGTWIFTDRPNIDYYGDEENDANHFESEDLNDLCIRLSKTFVNLNIKIQHYE